MNLQDFKKEIPEIFEKVRRDVKKVYGRHRAGLSLGLVKMGMYRGGFIGGMHFPPGTDIVMNKTPLQKIIQEQPYDVVWAYTYHILLHEYIHSLGVWDERQCRYLTRKVSEEIFEGVDHPALILAKNGISAFFPDLPLIYAPPDISPEGMEIEYIYGFDRESYSYYS